MMEITLKDAERLTEQIQTIRLFIAKEAQNRGEAAIILAAVLGEVLCLGVNPTNREGMLSDVVAMIRAVWKREDAAETVM